ncbi:MAG: AMP-binding protein [Sulfuritalea sp.]|nr:AMP-binding protein [Sulfuritalea sp.]
MTRFSWLTELATAEPNQALLISGARQWRAAEICDELLSLKERLATCRVLGVLADNSPAWVLADLAAYEAGVVHLPLPGFFSPGQLRHALEQTAADVVLTDQPERIGALDIGFAIIGHWQGLTWMQRVVEPVALPAGTAKISFTSGSTGAPKGVCLDGAGLIDTALAVRERLSDLPLRHHLAVLPLALLLENVAGIYAPLLRGMAVHLPPLHALGWRGMVGFDPGALDAAVRQADASSIILVPELLKAWTAFLNISGSRPSAALSFVAVGGARVASDLMEDARQLGIPAHQGYGLTEGGSVVTLNRPGDDADGVGRPLRHARIAIRSGEVIVGTRAFLGYLGSAAGDSGEFATGDLGELDAQGHLHLAGRRKNLLITSWGRNISPEWPEAALLADPRILQAVVVGDGQPSLSAILVPMPGASPSAIDLAVKGANETLPDYARIAHWIPGEAFTAANGLATGNGRPVRDRVAERYATAITALHAKEECRNAVL